MPKRACAVDEARSVRDFWFGPLPMSAEDFNRRMRFWFGDESSEMRRRLSLILLLDQFPRNMFRGSARAFATDGQALALTLSGMQSAADAALDAVERLFFYMPLQHAESREVQDESVAAYRRLLSESTPELHPAFAAGLRSAENHRGIIEKFGRFPYRNRVLGRTSTPQELEWLRKGGESFGQ